MISFYNIETHHFALSYIVYINNVEQAAKQTAEGKRIPMPCFRACLL